MNYPQMLNKSTVAWPAADWHIYQLFIAVQRSTATHTNQTGSPEKVLVERAYWKDLRKESKRVTERERERKSERELKCARLGVGVAFSVNVLLGINSAKRS